MKHGLDNTYTHHRCRCDECRTAHATTAREWRRRNQAANRADTPHGTVAGYNHYGCRCDACRVALNEYRRQRREASRA